MVRRKYSPVEYNLTDVKLKPIRGGTIILSTSEKGLCKLEQELNKTKDITEIYEVKRPLLHYYRYPQFSIGQVKPDLTAEEVRRAIVEQNETEGDCEDITVTRTHSQKNGNNAVIVEVTPPVFQQLKNKEKITIGWTVCPIPENLHITKCNRCASYRHPTRACKNRERCTECAGEHLAGQCGDPARRCTTRIESNSKWGTTYNIEHSFDSQCCEHHKIQMKRLKQEIQYT